MSAAREHAFRRSAGSLWQLGDRLECVSHDEHEKDALRMPMRGLGRVFRM